MELEESGSLTSDYKSVIKISHKNHMGLEQRQKYRSVEQDIKPRIKPTHLQPTNLTKEARIFNGEKTACSISGAGKTGQPHGKE